MRRRLAKAMSTNNAACAADAGNPRIVRTIASMMVVAPTRTCGRAPRAEPGREPSGSAKSFSAEDNVPSASHSALPYFAVALHAHTGRLVWVEHHRKISVLFLKQLDLLPRQYRRAKRIVLVVDNYYHIHKSRVTQRWVAENPKFQLPIQPTYYRWVNVIERLWKAMHDTVNRKYRCRSKYELCQSVAQFLAVVQPFPGSGHGVAHFQTFSETLVP